MRLPTWEPSCDSIEPVWRYLPHPRMVDSLRAPIRAAASTLDAGVDHLLRARRHLAPHLIAYPSSQSALRLAYGALRHIKAICQLAQCKPALDEPAMALARSALEVSIRSEPMRAEPNASMARRSISQFSLNREKSWTNPMWMTPSDSAAQDESRSDRSRSQSRIRKSRCRA